MRSPARRPRLPGSAAEKEIQVAHNDRLLAPGEMGAAVAQAVTRADARLVWASDGRSRATRERAQAAGIEDVYSIAAMAAASDILLSICPPHAAHAAAASISAWGFDGVYVDANAVAPSTSASIGAVVSRTNASYVDGSIIGQPSRAPATALLYLAGPSAPRIAALFAGGLLEAKVLDQVYRAHPP